MREALIASRESDAAVRKAMSNEGKAYTEKISTLEGEKQELNDKVAALQAGADAAPKWRTAAAAGGADAAADAAALQGRARELLASLDNPEALQAHAHVEEANETLKDALSDALVLVNQLKRELDRERKSRSPSRSKTSE